MDLIDILLTRGVDKIYPSKDALEKVLRSGKKLKLYQGFDPTGTQLHIGHAVGFRKLKQWQDLGHEVIFLIGDGTGQAGDPSGKKTSREKFFTNSELRQNGKDYVMQASKIVRFDGENPVKIMYNSDWLNKLGLVEILDIAGHFTLQQMLERDLYQERLKSGVELSLREFLYPLLQGYDSVAMGVDLEQGGSDQMFNMMMGRKLIKEYLNKEKFVMTVPLLTDSTGKKIGKTEGNVIGLTDKPNDFYAKIMSLGDDAIIPCFTLLTDKSESDINEIEKEIKSGKNPLLYKKLLALELTKGLNSEKEAENAQKYFENTVQNKDTENVTIEVPVLKLSDPKSDLKILVGPHVGSNSELKRLVTQNAIEVNNKVINDLAFPLKGGELVKIGKKKLIRIEKN